jgi:hypothetical protein
MSQLRTSRAEETIAGARSGHQQKGKMTEGHTNTGGEGIHNTMRI